MLINLRNALMATSNKEEEMYKELYEQFITGNFPTPGYTLTIPYRTFRNYCFSGVVVDTLEFTNLQSSDLYNNSSIETLAVQGGPNPASARVIKFPAFTYWGYYYKRVLAPFGSSLEHLYIPNVTSFQNSAYGFYGYAGSKLHVHIDKTMTEVKAMPNFPGFTSASLSLDKVVFECTDGTLAWDGSDWTESN